MNKNSGQILIVSLWILALLTVLAVTLGHRASMGIKLGQYQIDKLKALALAGAGLNVAFAGTTIENLSSGKFSGVGANAQDAFKQIHLPAYPDGYATVSYHFQDDGADQTAYGVFDEEKKININKAPRELLIELLNSVGVSNEDLAMNICAWRGDHGIPVPDYSEAGYVNKGAPLATLEELLLVKGMDQSVYELLKDHITVWGDGPVNVNTASKFVLDTLIAYGRNQISSGDNDPKDLADRIMALRPVESLGDLTDRLNQQRELSSGETNVLNELSALVDVRSSYVHILSTGRLAQSNIASTIECVMNRAKGRIVFWHEN